MTELTDCDAVTLGRMLATREVSARDVVAAHLARIDAVNPAINAIVTLVPEKAMDAAHAADERLARGRIVGPLHGLPVAHKDLAPTAGIRTTYGSPIFADNVPDIDAAVVSRAVGAGAITIGKTNTPEFGAGSHTFNAVFGVTRNPWDLSRTAGGSSGGAAAALAARMVPLADGSDLGGSLRNPANYCGVVGLRPSPGRCSSWPTLSGWGTMAVCGPMARSVADVALFLSVLAGPDPRSPISIPEDAALFADPLLDGDLRGVRLAWSPSLGGLPVDTDVADVLETARTVLVGAGALIEESDPPLAGADFVFETLRAHGFELGSGEHLDRHPELLKETVRWNILEGRALSGPDVGRAERLRTVLFAAMESFFDSYDALVSIVSQVPPFPVETEYPTVVAGQPMGSYIEWMRSCSRITPTACPALSIPAGFTPDGLPVGLQLVTRYRSERRLLELGHIVERALGASSIRPPVD